MIQFDVHIFQMGWNHQLVLLWCADLLDVPACHVSFQGCKFDLPENSLENLARRSPDNHVKLHSRMLGRKRTNKKTAELPWIAEARRVASTKKKMGAITLQGPCLHLVSRGYLGPLSPFKGFHDSIWLIFKIRWVGSTAQ